KLVPIGTNRGVVTRGAARRRRGLRVCALPKTGSASKTKRAINRFFVVLAFIRLLLTLTVGFQKDEGGSTLTSRPKQRGPLRSPARSAVALRLRMISADALFRPIRRYKPRAPRA